MDTEFSLLRYLAAMIAAVACTAWVVQRSSGPPATSELATPGLNRPGRRLTAFLLLSFMLLVACFQPVMFWDQPVEFDPEQISTPSLFVLQTLLLLTVVGWFLAGYSGLPMTRRTWVKPRSLDDSIDELLMGENLLNEEELAEKSSEIDAEAESSSEPLEAESAPVEVVERVHEGWGRELLRQCGLIAENPWRELGLGLALGVGVWFAVLVVLMILGAILVLIFGPDAMPQQPAEGVLLIVGMPVWVRIALSVAAGVSEEIFFRGFLQARLGIVVASLLFACAHLGYGQPTMLIGLTLLSFAYAFIVRWRGNVLAVIVAHTVFDLIQMLVVIPLVTELEELLPELEELGAPAASLLTGLIRAFPIW